MFGKRLVLVAFVALGFAAITLSPPSHATLRAVEQAGPPAGDLSTLAGSGFMEAGVATAEAEDTVILDGMTLEQAEAFNLAVRAEQDKRREGKPRPFVPVPVGDVARDATVTEPTEAGAERLVSMEVGPMAPNDMRYFLSHNITGAEVPTSQRSTIMEPTAVNLDTAVFYTGNWFAAKSTDSGNTFTYINPYTIFPAVNGGFCCDQVTAHAPAQNMALWGLQYIEDGTTNTLRIARAIGSAGIAANAWTYWNFTPQMVGFPNGVWFDYPSFTVGSTFLYVTSNAFYTSNYSFAGNVVMRISLAQLAAGGSIGFQYFRSNIGTERLTDGAATTMYWAGFTTTTQMRIHRWDDASNTIFWDNVNVNAFNWLNRDGVATSPDGTNWALRADSRPTTAYVANGVIGVMWSAKQGTGRPKPYAVHARFSEATRALVTQTDIWNNDHAWMYPAASPNAAGHLAGTLQIGGAASGTFAYPGTQVWIIDDITGASTGIGQPYYLSSSNDGPNNNAWGDFFSVRPHRTLPRTWVAASHTLQGGGGGTNTVPNYLWFGRERDRPVPAAITSPTPGSTLAGPAVTFNWNTGTGVPLQYWLYVGTTGVGSANIWNQDQGTALSRAVAGLPTTGGTVYVRLWTRFASGWLYIDYTYTAVSEARAAITSPTPGSTLGGSLVTFSWSAGAGALQYWLYVGTTGVGSANLYNQDEGLGRVRTVGIPSVGGAVYVRLWTRFAGGWQFNDYTYTAATAACSPAALLTPAPGTFTYASTVPHAWTAGTGNTQFWLYVGTTPGGTQVLNQNMGAALSANVAGVPQDVPVYSRLWYLCNGAWGFRDEVINPLTVRARLLSPAPFSVLPGASATFTWKAGTGSSQYWIYVGSSLGATDIWNQNQGTGLTRTVTGIPTDGRKVYVRLWSLASGFWYYTDYSFTASGTQRARLTAPVEGSVAGGATQGFAWTAGSSSTQYWLYVGDSLGAANLFNQNMLTATSVNVTGLPTDHRPLYARLWSLVSGAWVFNDYQFRAYDGGAARARLIAPANGSTLTGASATLRWHAATGGTQYWVYVGTTPGGANLANVNAGTNLSQVVNGLPTNGSTLYLRLWTFSGGLWTFNDYDVKAAP